MSRADVVDLPPCPICAGQLDIVYDRHGQIVAVCSDCHSGVTIPAAARERLRRKSDP
jgi:hypothetical protein